MATAAGRKQRGRPELVIGPVRKRSNPWSKRPLWCEFDLSFQPKLGRPKPRSRPLMALFEDYMSASWSIKASDTRLGRREGRSQRARPIGSPGGRKYGHGGSVKLPSTTALARGHRHIRRRLAIDVSMGRLNPDDIDEEALSARMLTAAVPDPDLIIELEEKQALELPSLAVKLRRVGGPRWIVARL